MFTPPASPAPPRTLPLADVRDISPAPSSSDEEGSQYLLVPPALPHRISSVPQSDDKVSPPSVAAQYASSVVAKHRTARHTRWTILLVPLVLVLITASTRYVSHPALLDMFSADSSPAAPLSWTPHKRHASPDPAPDGSSAVITFPTPTSSSAATQSVTASQTVPTIPASPPVLPTPFPQPFDQTLSRNFSTQGCLDFFTNMTQATAFRSCRPFSLLVTQSTAFFQAQANVTFLNEVIWGTCNTNTDADQCVSNMGWFVETLEDVCSQDLKANNAMVTQTRDGLLAYSLMRDVACLPDQATNAYCYVEAAHSSNAGDLYFYKLPLGYQLPASTKPSCSACTKSVMNLYAQSNLTALAGVYDSAATIANGVCGSGFVTVPSGGVSGGAGALALPSFVPLLFSLLGFFAMWSW